jgi:hypothetical protein
VVIEEALRELESIKKKNKIMLGQMNLVESFNGELLEQARELAVRVLDLFNLELLEQARELAVL